MTKTKAPAPETFPTEAEALAYAKQAASETRTPWFVSRHDLSDPAYTIGRQLLETNSVIFVASDVDVGDYVAKVEAGE